MAEASLPSDSADRGAPPFERLLEHAAWLRVLARHLVDDAAAADDLVQETWLAAARRPPTATRPLQPWLAGVARKLAAFTRRGEDRRRRREGEQPALGVAPSTDELVARAELQRKLVERVLALREPGRSTVLLCYFEGLSPSEAAREIGVPAATVRARLKRALDELREQFDAEQRGGGADWRGAFAVFAARTGEVGGAAMVVAKVAAGLVAAAGVMAWKCFEHDSRDVVLPVRVAAAAIEKPRREEIEAAATPALARELEPPRVEPPAHVTTIAAAQTADTEAAESDPFPTIRGRVLLPDGSLAGRCEITYKYKPAPGHGLTVIGYSGATSGEFEFSFEHASTASTTRIRLVAQAEVDGRLLSRSLELLPVSQDDLVIQLVDAPRLRVRVVDEQRAPIEMFCCNANDSWGRTSREDETDAEFVRSMTRPQSLHRNGDGTRIESHPGGRCEIALPLERYVVVIDAPGFARGVAGPFRVEPPLDPLPREVEVVLRRTSAIAGRVVAEGKPVAGALVALHGLSPKNRHFVLDDLVVDVDPWNSQRVTTDADGAFALPCIDAPDGARLFVLANGFARSELAIDPDRLDRSSDLEVELRPGGTLAGTLTGLETMISAGRTDRITALVVVAECRDLWPRAAHVDAQGHFRIEHLAPGGWHLSMPRNGAHYEEVDLGKSSSGGAEDGPVPPPDWNVEIREGEETSISFDAFTGPTSR